MSLWWVQKDQLDDYQLQLIEDLPLGESHLILGPPGSGKTNVLLRRAQFVRSQDMPNVLVLTFTRSLTEFVKTGCYDRGREIYPPSLIQTIESWLRSLYRRNHEPLPPDPGDLTERKRILASGALQFSNLPLYDALFIDEAQDLLAEEIELLKLCTGVLFFSGDDQQRIFTKTDGLQEVRRILCPKEHTLPFHYRLAPEICRMADRIMIPQGRTSLASSCHYKGPKPGVIKVDGPLSRERQRADAVGRIRDQLRIYGTFIQQGDRIGVVVSRTDDRETVLEFLEQDPALSGKCKIIRARSDEDDDYDPSFDVEKPICILTVKGCKGLEFRTLHWLFSDDLRWLYDDEHYYTVVTRSKTELDIYHEAGLPEQLARGHAATGESRW